MPTVTQNAIVRYPVSYDPASLIAQSVKSLTAMQEPWVRPLGWEDALEKKMATYSSILAWRIPWIEESRAAVYRVAKSWTKLK